MEKEERKKEKRMKKWFFSLSVPLILMGGGLEGSWFKKPKIELKNVTFKSLSKESLELKMTLMISNQNSIGCRYKIGKITLYDEKGQEIGFIKKIGYKSLKAKKKHKVSVETVVETEQVVKLMFNFLMQKDFKFKVKGKAVVNIFLILFFKVSFEEQLEVDSGAIF